MHGPNTDAHVLGKERVDVDGYAERGEAALLCARRSPGVERSSDAVVWTCK